ncbi:phage protein NinX family protein [Citrobacter werkmanii]|uniref:phage protein NinX family protein n=1 Tax=Citrobacter werkmanii TaxID=67827 RepID=UPI00300C3FFF
MKQKMKVSELTGSALDYAVDRALNSAKYSEQLSIIRTSGDGYRPSSSWKISGPLLEKFRLDVIADPEGETWWADKTDGTERGHLHGTGPTPLIAICRALALMGGDEIDIPKELLKQGGAA